MDDVNSRKLADPTYESVNEFVLKYVSQWLLHILNNLPGHTKDIFKEIECFILGMIIDYESRVKDSPYLIELINRFTRDVYGYESGTYKVKECHFIDKSDFVKENLFEETKPYTSIMGELKRHIRETLRFLRQYEEDPARLIELREKQARAEAYRRAIEEDKIELAKADALDAAALDTVVERSAEVISTQERLQNAIDKEAAAAKVALRLKAILKRDQDKKRERHGAVWRVVQKARKRGEVPNIKLPRKTHRRYEEGFKSATRRASTHF